MLTKNFKTQMAMILQRSNNDVGLLPITAYNGTEYYISPSGIPGINSPTFTVATSASAAGICIGTGNTAATENDYQLETPITSGFNTSVTQVVALDVSGNPYLQFDITITNTSGAAMTISEIGYRQNVRGSTTQGSAGSNRVCLFDRTVLSSPVTIPAGENGVIRYTLKTVIG